MAEDFKVGYLAVEDDIRGIRADGVTRAAILEYDPVTGTTIVKALGTAASIGAIAFQDKNGDPIALDVAVNWGDVLGKPTTIGGFGITDAYTGTEVDTLLAGKAALVHTHAWADITGEPTTLAGYGITDAAALIHTHDADDITSGTLAVVRGGTGLSALGTALHVLRVNAAGTALEFAAATGGMSAAFVDIANAAGTVQFSATGADALRFAAGSDLAVAFDSATNKITFSYTGGGTGGISAAYATVSDGTTSATAMGADALTFAGTGGVTPTLNAGTKVLTYALGNHSAALLTSGILPDARIAASGVTQHQAALSIAATQLTGTIDTARISGAYTGVTSVGTLTAGVWNASVIGPAYLGTGTRDGTKFLRDDGAWTAVSGGSSTAVSARAYWNNGSGATLANSTWGVIPLDAETFDTDGFHDNATNNSRMTVPSGKAGKYLVLGTVAFAFNATGSRWAGLRVNGTEVAINSVQAIAVSFGSSVDISAVLNLSVGDYIELFAFQNSGGALGFGAGSARNWLEVIYLGS